MKNRTLAIILSLGVFLAAQTLGIAHAAAYGPGKHKHHGHICDIYLSADQAKAAPPPLPGQPVPVCHGVTFVLPKRVALGVVQCPAGFPRAPPGALLS